MKLLTLGVLLFSFLLLSEAFLFGVQVTGTGGNVIGGADPNQTAALFGIGALTAALSLGVKDVLTRRPRTRTRTRTVSE